MQMKGPHVELNAPGYLSGARARMIRRGEQALVDGPSEFTLGEASAKNHVTHTRAHAHTQVIVVPAVVNRGTAAAGL